MQVEGGSDVDDDDFGLKLWTASNWCIQRRFVCTVTVTNSKDVGAKRICSSSSSFSFIPCLITYLSRLCIVI